VATEATATFERAALVLIKDRQKREHLLFRQVLAMSFQSEFQSPTHPPPAALELALLSGSARTWEHKIKNTQKAHDVALRFALSKREARRVNQRLTHLKALLEELFVSAPVRRFRFCGARPSRLGANYGPHISLATALQSGTQRKPTWRDARSHNKSRAGNPATASRPSTISHGGSRKTSHRRQPSCVGDT
jgi:hypothetical protein